MDIDLTTVLVCSILFVALPWIILSHWAKFRSARGISTQDEQLLDDLYNSARRLDQRLDSIERIIAADNPNWKDGRIADHSISDRRLGN